MTPYHPRKEGKTIQPLLAYVGFLSFVAKSRGGP